MGERSVSVSGLFISTPGQVAAIVGRTVCFGEIIGKLTQGQDGKGGAVAVGATGDLGDGECS